MSELLPCPFCGVAPLERWEDNPNGPKYPGHWFVWCENLDCRAGGEAMEETKEEARAAWNTRVPAPQPSAPGHKQIAYLIQERCGLLLSVEFGEEIAGIGPMSFAAADDILAALAPSSASRDATIEECAKVADARALELRAKAKAVKMPQRQSYFAQSIEARVIAEHIRALAKPPFHGAICHPCADEAPRTSEGTATAETPEAEYVKRICKQLRDPGTAFSSNRKAADLIEALYLASLPRAGASAPEAWDAHSNRSYEPVEKRAAEIYATFAYEEAGEKPDWQPGGNSSKQDEARQKARNELRDGLAVTRPLRESPCSHAAIISLDGKWHCQKCGDAIEIAVAHSSQHRSGE